MKILPLYFYPTTKIFVDDDSSLLQILKVYLSQKYHLVKTFNTVTASKDFFNKYKNSNKNNSLLKIDMDDEYVGTVQRTPINFDVTKISKIAEENDRHEEVSIAVLDYNMPEANGLQLSKEIFDMPMSKILLTGKATQDDIIAAFNESLIDKYLKKGEENFIDNLELAFDELSKKYFERKTRPLLNYLQTENLLPLSDELFIDFFNIYMDKNDVSEYYLIDKQGSFLTINRAGQRQYLVVFTEDNLNDWINEYEQELSSDMIGLVKKNKYLPFFGVGMEASQIDSSLWAQHFHASEVLNGRETYYWATVTEH